MTAIDTAADTAEAATSQTRRRGREYSPRLVLALLALPSLLISIDFGVLTVALPQMAADLQPTTAELLWMNDIYGFLVGGTMITMGTVGDRLGRRRLIVLCSAVFAVASALAAFATAPWMIIAARAVLGVAGAGIMPASMALIGRLFPDPKRNVAAMGVYMTCFVGGMAAAPLVGGVMIEHWWWGSVFLLGVPVMVVVLIAAPRVLPEYRAESAGRIDVPSAALSLSSILLIVGALKLAVGEGLSWRPLAVAAVGLALGAVFVRRQHSLADPLVDLSLLRRPGVARVLQVLFLTAMLMGGTSLFYAFFLQSAQGLSPLQAALWLVPSMVAMMVSSNLGPWLGRRLPPSRVVLGGLVVMASGFVSFALVGLGGAGLAAMVCGSVLSTAGIGAAVPFLMNDVISRAPQERAGSAASLAQTANEIGIATGMVVLGSVGTVAYRASMTDSTGGAAGSWVEGFGRAAAEQDPVLLGHVQEAFVSGFRAVGVFGVAVMAVVLVLRLRRR